MSDQNRAVVTRMFEEVMSGGNFDTVDELFTADYHDNDPASEEDVRGPSGVREEVGMYRAGLPDLRFTIEDQLADGDQVATRFTCTGTHDGDLMGIPATGNAVALSGIVIHRVNGGKIEEGYWNWDTLGLLQQIGALPAEQPTA